MNDLSHSKWKHFLSTLEEVAKDNHILVERQSPEAIESSSQEKTIALPKFKLTEKWGTPGTKSRNEIEMFLGKLPAGSLQEKIQFVNSFISNCKEKCVEKKTTSSILANLVFLETLATIIYDFNYSTGGFLFEVFLAALLGTSSQQVVATQSRKKGQAGDIADITGPDGEPISLKFFKEGASQYISGSLKDLKASILKYGKSITYLVVIKAPGENKGDVKRIDFWQFELGAYVDEGDDSDYLTPVEGDIMGDDFEKGPQFKIPVKRMQAVMQKPIASLFFGSRKELQHLANLYVRELGEDIENIYNNLDKLSQNINKYLVADNMMAGSQAVKDAEALHQSTQNIAPNPGNQES